MSWTPGNPDEETLQAPRAALPPLEGPRLVVGCGYLGARVAKRWREAGHDVFAVTRSAKRAVVFAQSGYRPISADVMRLETLAELPAATTVLYAVGYDRSQGYGIEDVYLRGLINVLNALPAGTGRVIYISSTGVYNNRDGAWIDETSPMTPDRAGGRACLAAEQALQAHERGADAVILRLAGIYGPGRIPSREALEMGRTLPVNPDGWLNLIHVEDAVSAVLAAERAPAAPRQYLVSDGCPVARRDYYAELARLLDAPQPRFLSVTDARAEGSRGSGNKRISNARMMAELGVKLAYPSFREGLKAIIDGI